MTKEKWARSKGNTKVGRSSFKPYKSDSITESYNIEENVGIRVAVDAVDGCHGRAHAFLRCADDDGHGIVSPWGPRCRNLGRSFRSLEIWRVIGKERLHFLWKLKTAWSFKFKDDMTFKDEDTALGVLTDLSFLSEEAQPLLLCEMILNTMAVSSAIFWTPITHHCTATHSSNSILISVVDTTITGLITDSQKALS